MKFSRLLIAACFCASSFMTAQAAGDIWADITPKDWSYQALQTLINHGAIEDTKGISLNGQTYTRYELTPLVAHVVEKREFMNDTDKNLAIRLYSEWRDELMAYNRDQEIRAKGHAEESEGKALTQEEVAKKIENFTIDDRRVAVGGDVRLRTSNRDRSDYRARVGFVISSNGTAAPDALYDKVGKMEIQKADEEAAKSREKFKKIKEQRDKEDAEAIAKAAKEAANKEARGDKDAANGDSNAAKEVTPKDAKAAKELERQQAEAAIKAARDISTHDAVTTDEKDKAVKQSESIEQVNTNRTSEEAK